MIKMLFSLFGASCAFVSAGIAFRWSIFDLDDPALRGEGHGWLGLAVMAIALAFAWEPLVTFGRELRRIF